MHYNGLNIYLFVNSVETHKLKAKDSEINETPLCLGSVSERFSTDKMKKTRSIDFSVDYNSIDVVNILDIQKYLIKKHDINQCLDFSKKNLLDY